MRPQERAVRKFPLDRYTLIPLHRPLDSKTKNGVLRMLGKAPIDKNWTKAAYDNEEVIKRCVAEKRNIGVRLRSTQVVIDIDPRNGGADTYPVLFAELGIDESIFPRVVTGSGGLHLYALKPKDIPVLDTLGEEYEGVEFKSRGRQVVAPGSIHPDTNKPYQWDSNYPPIEDAPMLPAKLLKLITRPTLTVKTRGGGEYDQETIARMLEHLDARKFNDHKKWLNMMMACHHASNGDARSEFIEWSITDPAYRNNAAEIGRRWDSLHRNKLAGIKSGTLDMYMREHGQHAHIPYKGAAGIDKDEWDAAGDTLAEYGSEEPDGEAEDDEVADDVEHIDGEDEFDPPELQAKLAKTKGKTKSKKGGDPTEGLEVAAGYGEDALNQLETLNAKYTWLAEGGKPRIISKLYDHNLDRASWIRMAPHDFEQHYRNRRIERDMTGLGRGATPTIEVGKAWCEWPKRKQVEGIYFDPSGREVPGYMNLWDGFAYAPGSKTGGTWDRLKELMFEVLSGGDDLQYEYLMRWCAHMIQHPAINPEVAVAIRGQKGTGKGTLGNTLCKLIGRHALHISSGGLLTGRFNSHLEDCLFLFADEALLPYDKQAESVLKALITEPTMNVERKGVDVITHRNYLHIYMASNEKWAVPATFDERRFYVTEANNKKLGNRDFFEALHKELNSGGLDRMFWDLAHLELPDRWHPREVPQTQALIDQKVRAMPPLATFFYNALCQKQFEGMQTRPSSGWDWDTKPIRFFVQDFKEHFAAHCRTIGVHAGSHGKSNWSLLAQEIKELFPTANTDLREPIRERVDIYTQAKDGRAPAIQLPSIPECRAMFETKLKGVPSWPNLDVGTVKRKLAADDNGEF